MVYISINITHLYFTDYNFYYEPLRRKVSLNERVWSFLPLFGNKAKKLYLPPSCHFCIQIFFYKYKKHREMIFAACSTNRWLKYTINNNNTTASIKQQKFKQQPQQHTETESKSSQPSNRPPIYLSHQP